MCVVSMVYDAVRTVPLDNWTRPAFTDFQEIIRRIERLDEKLGQKDCVDPAKAAWMREVEDRLRKLEDGPQP